MSARPSRTANLFSNDDIASFEALLDEVNYTADYSPKFKAGPAMPDIVIFPPPRHRLPSNSGETRVQNVCR
jgi:hypothetical protein